MAGSVMSRRIRSVGDLVASGVGMLAIYASVRLAMRAGSIQDEEAARVPKSARGSKRERPYDHAKTGLEVRGGSKAVAEEVAARTVNKQWTRANGTRTAGSISDLSSSRRGVLDSHRASAGRTYRQLYEEARLRGVPGRSAMSKADLETVLCRSKSGAAKAS
ncbi:MAG TPA: hypothetical protein VIJ34_01070 [Acidimicrobiales bacterium]